METAHFGAGGTEEIGYDRGKCVIHDCIHSLKCVSSAHIKRSARYMQRHGSGARGVI